jgi:hypothetical protein
MGVYRRLLSPIGENNNEMFNSKVHQHAVACDIFFCQLKHLVSEHAHIEYVVNVQIHVKHGRKCKAAKSFL